MIQLAQSSDGRLIIASNQPFPADVKRVEYYREQKLFMLAFDDDEKSSDLMPCEVSDDIAKIIHASPDVVIMAMKEEGSEPYGYIVPLVQIGL